MHRDHHHHHGADHHHHHHGHGRDGDEHGTRVATRPPLGHNRRPGPAQWQVPHRHDNEQPGPSPPEQRDLDLVEASFVEGFARCSDPTSFLRLAGVPFTGTDAGGRQLNLLRVEIGEFTDIGSVVPLLGGQGMRYAPLPGRMTSRRRQLAFVYHDGRETIRLDFKQTRALTEVSDREGDSPLTP